jgi:CRP-like cAMP-binding protein
LTWPDDQLLSAGDKAPDAVEAFSDIDNAGRGARRPRQIQTVARFEPHRVIFSKGDKGDCLYGILSGRVWIYSNSAEGAEIMLNVLEQGDLFGEIALLDGSTRTASAAAMEQTDLLRIHRAHFLPYVKANPDLILAMLTLLCQRLRWTSSVIEEYRFSGVPGAAGEASAGVGRALPQTPRARGYGALVAIRPRQHGRRQAGNNQQAARPLAFRRDSDTGRGPL